MPRPRNKQELEDLSRENYEKLINLINSFDEKEQLKEFPKGTMNRNIRDVLAHLHEWHLMMINWYEIGMKGQQPDMPAKGYSWRNTSELNYAIWKNYRSSKFNQVKDLLDSSYKQVQKIIQKHSEEDLFEKRKFKWTGTTSMGAYLISATSSHYDWAFKLIRKAKKHEK